MSMQALNYLSFAVNVIPFLWGLSLIFMVNKAKLVSPTVDYTRPRQLAIVALVIGFVGGVMPVVSYFLKNSYNRVLGAYLPYGFAGVGLALAVTGQVLFNKAK